MSGSISVIQRGGHGTDLAVTQVLTWPVTQALNWPVTQALTWPVTCPQPQDPQPPSQEKPPNCPRLLLILFLQHTYGRLASLFLGFGASAVPVLSPCAESDFLILLGLTQAPDKQPIHSLQSPAAPLCLKLLL